MRRPLRLLLLEDCDEDALLLLREVRRGGFDPEVTRTDTPEGLQEALRTKQFDIVVSDFSMPRMTAPDALEIVSATGFDLPFLIVSGTIGEDAAVASLKAGAHDFILKDKLARLIPAMERELREASMRSERRKMEEQLVLSDRMVSIGTLAAGVAHEINNPLAAVLANLDYMESELAKIPNGPQGLEEIVEPLRDARFAADRVRQIVRDLKLFSRPDEERRGPVDLHRVLDSTLRMTENEVRHRARLVKKYGEVPPVDGNEARLGQVFLNLVVNAAQAMPEGNADQHEIRVITSTDESGRVLVEIHDTGSGISAAMLPHVFEPFFTTKPVGVGTGLGLAICHRIVTSYRGELLVESEVGKGTVFKVALPATRWPTANTDAPRATGGDRQKRGARVIAVDDEAMVGIAVGRMLAPDHTVTALTDARAVLERVSRGERFDIILCNVMMPSMSGPELHEELARIAPEQAERMVFMTGGAFTPAARAFLDRVKNLRLEKPFDATELRHVVEDYAR